ncbi:MAG: HK97 family phage prohead protease, partial [Pararhizobium sp.]
MSDNSLDRMGDVIEQTGWQLENFRNHPVALFNHDRDQVIGKWENVTVKDGRLTGRLALAEPGTSPLVDTVRALVKQKILRAVSVGFRALAKEKLGEKASEHFGPFRFTKTELLECSLVSIPANANALAVAKDLPRDLIAEIFRKPATEDLARSTASHGKPAAQSLETKRVSTMSTTSTVAAKILGAQDNLKVLRAALAELSGKDEMSPDDSERYTELPKQIDAAKTELEKHLAAERAMMDDIAQN